MEKKVKNLIERIRPVLSSDGGDIMFIGIENGVVVICMIGDVCRVMAIEKYLIKNAPGIRGVKNLATEFFQKKIKDIAAV